MMNQGGVNDLVLGRALETGLQRGLLVMLIVSRRVQIKCVKLHVLVSQLLLSYFGGAHILVYHFACEDDFMPSIE